MIPKIREVHIRNYKSIDQAVVRLDDLTILIGQNGSGKSNFMDAIAFVRDCLSDSVDDALYRRGGFGGTIWRLAPANASIGIRLVIDLSRHTVADYAIRLSENAQRSAIIVEERCEVRSNNNRVDRFTIRNGEFIEPIPGIRARIEPGHLALYAASATAEYTDVYEFLVAIRNYGIVPEKLADLQRSDAGLQLLPDGGNAASVLRQIEKVDPARFERVSELVRTVVPGVRTVRTRELAVGLESLWFDEDAPLPDRSVSFMGARMSEGTLRMLGFLLAVYQPQTPSVLSVEEPEANVHPAAADLVTSVLIDASRRCQVLIATHSPEILDHDALSDGVFRVVSKAAGHSVIAPVAAATLQVIREHLYSPGELLRINELQADLAAVVQLEGAEDVFGAPAGHADEVG